MAKLKDRKIEELKCCPYCKGTSGYYEKVQFSGNGKFYKNFDGECLIESSEAYDYLDSVSSKFLYCMDCDKRIAPNTH